MTFFFYSVVITTWWLAITLYLLIKGKTIAFLKAQPLAGAQPSVAIIIAVRNEEDDLEKALQSVCNLSYSNYRIIVLNDRSTDCTPEILATFLTHYPQLEVIHIKDLPQGWLGKNHALYQGYLNSNEEWLLFTDADVEFHPNALSKAMVYVDKNKLDHLTILPEIVSTSALLNSMLGTFTLLFMMQFRPWAASKPKSKASIGIGAFNLVRREAYERAGTHQLIKLRPDDDLKLGNLIKAAGFRQDVLVGKGYVGLEWYKNVPEFVNGLMKNSFAVSGYSLLKTLLGITFILLFIALPVPLMLLFGTNTIRLMACLILVFQAAYMATPVLPNKWWHALTIPLGGFLLAYITARSAFITLKQKGIYWRESFYPLDMLKGN
ncbi:glycosyltransferase [Mucilaginibacter agri]|uniref:Glycosyltransferase n=1 Tax=Mucilaginibacter agri TaxID=2695265 RepID=A0A965ZEP8_9SPHI|nr:glycosyltransferase family 2 protein [Mucilaginibacter agri]NCD68682.1 glycosyltransferase [Mucilaginibacter agri]